MVTNYRRPDKFAKVLTTRVLSIETSAATKIVMTSGAKAMYVCNVGPSTLAWGDTAILASTGNLLFYSMQELFHPIQGDFEVYFRADSVQGTLSISEFV